MRTTAANHQIPVAFSRVNAIGKTQVYVLEVPTARRSVFSQVRHAVYREAQRQARSM